MRFITICLLTWSILGAYEYDKLLLRAQAYTFPKIVVLDKNYRQKLNKNSVEVAILYERIDKLVAMNFKNMIKEKFASTISSSALEVTLVEFDKLDKKYSAYIALKSKKSSIERVATLATAQGRMMFVYDSNDLKHGALVSLVIEDETSLFMNKKEIKRSKIDFNTAIFSIVRLW